MRKKLKPSWIEILQIFITSILIGFLWHFGAESLVIGIVMFGLMAINKHILLLRDND